MKKIFTLILGIFALSSVFAQNSHGHNYPANNHDYTYNNNGGYSQNGYGSYDKGYGNYGNDRNGSYRSYSDYDHRDNRSYDKQYDKRRDRSYNAYDRNQRVYREERDRNKTLKGVGVGMVIGGVLGAILSH